MNVYDWEGNNPIPPELWYVEYSKHVVQVDSLFVGYYLNGSLSTHRVGGYTLVRYTFL
jgi:hypothetical protein